MSQWWAASVQAPTRLHRFLVWGSQQQLVWLALVLANYLCHWLTPSACGLSSDLLSLAWCSARTGSCLWWRRAGWSLPAGDRAVSCGIFLGNTIPGAQRSQAQRSRVVQSLCLDLAWPKGPSARDWAGFLGIFLMFGFIAVSAYRHSRE